MLLARELGCRPGDLLEHGFDVIGAGTLGLVGEPPTPEACTAARELGANIDEQRSNALTVRMIDAADHVFVAAERHATQIRDYAPDAWTRIRPILRTGRDLPDPIGRPIDEYRECAARIREELQAVTAELMAGRVS